MKRLSRRKVGKDGDEKKEGTNKNFVYFTWKTLN